MPDGVRLIALVDDAALVGLAHTGELNPALENVSLWMSDNGLRLAAHKTEAILVTVLEVRATDAVGWWPGDSHKQDYALPGVGVGP